MSCAVELFPSSCRANAVAFIPYSKLRPDRVTASSSDPGENDPSEDLPNQLSAFTLDESHTTTTTTANSIEYTSFGNWAGKKSPVYITDAPCGGNRNLSLYIHPNELFGAVELTTSVEEEEDGIPSVPKLGEAQRDVRTENTEPVQRTTEHSTSQDSSLCFNFQLPTRISSFRVVSISTICGGDGTSKDAVVKLSLTLANRVSPLTITNDDNEVKLLRSVRPFRLECRQCSETVAAVETPTILALPSVIWMEMSETLVIYAT